MSVSPKISLVAYEDRPNNFIFVAIPDQRGRYIRTDKSVALVACRQCKAPVGVPCESHGADGWSSTTHSVRRADARREPNKRMADDVIDNSHALEELAWPELPTA